LAPRALSRLSGLPKPKSFKSFTIYSVKYSLGLGPYLLGHIGCPHALAITIINSMLYVRLSTQTSDGGPTPSLHTPSLRGRPRAPRGRGSAQRPAQGTPPPTHTHAPACRRRTAPSDRVPETECGCSLAKRSSAPSGWPCSHGETRWRRDSALVISPSDTPATRALSIAPFSSET